MSLEMCLDKVYPGPPDPKGLEAFAWYSSSTFQDPSGLRR